MSGAKAGELQQFVIMNFGKQVLNPEVVSVDETVLSIPFIYGVVQALNGTVLGC